MKADGKEVQAYWQLYKIGYQSLDALTHLMVENHVNLGPKSGKKHGPKRPALGTDDAAFIANNLSSLYNEICVFFTERPMKFEHYSDNLYPAVNFSAQAIIMDCKKFIQCAQLLNTSNFTGPQLMAWNTINKLIKNFILHDTNQTRLEDIVAAYERLLFKVPRYEVQTTEFSTRAIVENFNAQLFGVLDSLSRRFPSYENQRATNKHVQLNQILDKIAKATSSRLMNQRSDMSKKTQEQLKCLEIERIVKVQERSGMDNQRYISRKQQDFELILDNIYKLDCRLNNQRFEMGEEKRFDMFMTALHSLVRNLRDRYHGQDASPPMYRKSGNTAPLENDSTSFH